MEAIPLCYLASKLNLLCRIQHRFILIASYTYAARFGPFSGHRQAYQYKNHEKEDTVK